MTILIIPLIIALLILGFTAGRMSKAPMYFDLCYQDGYEDGYAKGQKEVYTSLHVTIAADSENIFVAE